MSDEKSDFELVLSRNSSLNVYPNNRLNAFTIELQQTLNLNGKDMVAPQWISFPKTGIMLAMQTSFVLEH